MRKYSVDSTFFRDINSHEKSYWLGFISADGHLFSGGGIVAGIQLELGEKDLEQLKRFRGAIGSSHPIKQTTHGIYTENRIRICSAPLAKQLINLGLSRNKSNKIEFPNIKQEYFPSFVLGYFDGDGCITIGKNKRPQLQVLGNLQFLSTLVEVIASSTGTKKVPIYNGSGIFRVSYGSKSQIIAIREWLYSTSCLSLDRKKEKFFSF